MLFCKTIIKTNHFKSSVSVYSVAMKKNGCKRIRNFVRVLTASYENDQVEANNPAVIIKHHHDDHGEEVSEVVVVAMTVESVQMQKC